MSGCEYISCEQTTWCQKPSTAVVINYTSSVLHACTHFCLLTVQRSRRNGYKLKIKNVSPGSSAAPQVRSPLLVKPTPPPLRFTACCTSVIYNFFVDEKHSYCVTPRKSQFIIYLILLLLYV